MKENQPNVSQAAEIIDSAERERTPMPEPQIYVADLAAYNNGILHGLWLDAAREPDAIHEDINAMLAASPEPGAEEFAIHDYEQFGSCRVHEYDSIELVSAIARGIKQYGYAFAAWADVQEGEPELLDDFEEAFIGEYESVAAYVQECLEERGAEAELERLLAGSELADLAGYITIDTEALARDWFLGGDINVYKVPTEVGGGVWLFH
jgi:antirestriction protein